MAAAFAAVYFGSGRGRASDAHARAASDSLRAAAAALVARADSLAAAGDSGCESYDHLGDAYIEAAECLDSARRICPSVAVDSALSARVGTRVAMLDTLLSRQIAMLDSIPSATRVLRARKARIEALGR